MCFLTRISRVTRIVLASLEWGILQPRICTNGGGEPPAILSSSLLIFLSSYPLPVPPSDRPPSHRFTAVLSFSFSPFTPHSSHFRPLAAHTPSPWVAFGPRRRRMGGGFYQILGLISYRGSPYTFPYSHLSVKMNPYGAHETSLMTLLIVLSLSIIGDFWP